MRIAILARGPSIWSTWAAADQSAYDLVLAINGTINVFQADWLVSADPKNLRLLTGHAKAGAIYRSKLLQPNEIPADNYHGKPVIDADTQMPAPPYRQSFSIETAIHAAATMFHGEQIDLFGCDMSGPDPKAISNGACGERVDDGRWKLERANLEKAIAAYEVEIVRHTIDGGGDHA